MSKIAENLLCMQCGVCYAVCRRGAIEISETPAGLVQPVVDESRCVKCGSCLAVCPGKGIDFDDLDIADPCRGHVAGAYAGHATDPRIRSGAQGGGLITALLGYAFDARLIDAALVTGLADDGSCRTLPFLARSLDEALGAQGSKYTPAPVLSVLRDATPGERLAVVGLPCHVQAIHNLRVTRHPLAADICLLIGLFCDRTLTYRCIDLMAGQAGLDPTQIRSIRTEGGRKRIGWAGEVRFRLNDDTEQAHPASLRIGLKEYCTPPRCRICLDKTNVYSDISVGDTWGLPQTEVGESAALARTERGIETLAKAQEAGAVELHEIDAAAVFRGQGVANRRETVAVFSRSWRRLGLAAPVCPLNESYVQTSRHVERRCHRLLAFNVSAASSTSPAEALATVERRIRRDRLLAGAKAPLRSVYTTMKRLRHSAGGHPQGR